MCVCLQHNVCVPIELCCDAELHVNLAVEYFIVLYARVHIHYSATQNIQVTLDCSLIVVFFMAKSKI